jgi:hypothetical protein
LLQASLWGPWQSLACPSPLGELIGYLGVSQIFVALLPLHSV